VRNRALLSAIRVIHWNALVERGHGVGEHRITRLMRVVGIRAKTVKKWRATTQSNHRLPVAENTLDRQFTGEPPNRVWAGDSTYVWTAEGWLYLAVVLDRYSCTVIGWAMGHRLIVDLAEQALAMALANRNPKADLLHHSDRGSQYAATADHAWHDRPHVKTGELLG
jgi:putative transposase